MVDENVSQGRSPQPAEVLVFLSGVRHRKEDPERTFFSIRFTRVFDSRPSPLHTPVERGSDCHSREMWFVYGYERRGKRTA